MRRSILLPVSLAIVAFLGGAAIGQDIEGTYDNKGKLTEINNLLSGDELQGCSAESRRYAGTVTVVRFSEGRKIGDFPSARGRRQGCRTARSTRGRDVSAPRFSAPGSSDPQRDVKSLYSAV